MTDRELLELAAKAAGYKIVGNISTFIAQPDHREGGFVIPNNLGGDSCWNPLTDDGDALRLAVKLNLMITITPGTSYADHYHDNLPNMAEAQINDPYIATRRAIVRAAAEIGKTK